MGWLDLFDPSFFSDLGGAASDPGTSLDLAQQADPSMGLNFLDTVPQAASDFSSYAEPALTSGMNDGSSYWSDLLSGGSQFGKMAGDILGNSTFQRLAFPAAAIGIGSVLGSKAGSAVEKKFQPTAQEQNVQNQIYGQPIDFSTLAAQMSQMLSPQIQETLDRERQSANALTNRASLISPYSSALGEGLGRERAATNRGIASAISSAVSGARGQNLNAMADTLARSQQTRGQGVQTGLQAAGQAGQAPIQALLLSQLMSGRGGNLGTFGV